MVSTKDSAFFECAFFVLRQAAPTAGAGEDMLQEAARLVGQAPGARRRKRGKMGIRALFWLLGVLTGALISVLFMLILR